MEVPVRFVCILTIPRTGSSHLCALLDSCPDLNVKGELFHHRWIGRLDDRERAALAGASGNALGDDARLCLWRRENPLATLECLHAAGHRRTVVFKLFPAHVKRPCLQREILERPDVGFLLLRRRPIESYISAIKARTAKAWDRLDTTALRPALDADDFIAWCERTRDWYAWLAQGLERRPLRTLTYERDLDSNDAARSLHRVLDALQAIGVSRPACDKTIVSCSRQDREADYRRRVSDWESFEATLRADPARSSLLDWAEAAPA